MANSLVVVHKRTELVSVTITAGAPPTVVVVPGVTDRHGFADPSRRRHGHEKRGNARATNASAVLERGFQHVFEDNDLRAAQEHRTQRHQQRCVDGHRAWVEAGTQNITHATAGKRVCQVERKVRHRIKPGLRQGVQDR